MLLIRYRCPACKVHMTFFKTWITKRITCTICHSLISIDKLDYSSSENQIDYIDGFPMNSWSPKSTFDNPTKEFKTGLFAASHIKGNNKREEKYRITEEELAKLKEQIIEFKRLANATSRGILPVLLEKEYVQLYIEPFPIKLDKAITNFVWHGS